MTTSTDMWVPGGDSSLSPSTRSKLAAAIAKGQQIVKLSTSNSNCKITQQKREEPNAAETIDICKTESRAISIL